MEIKRLTFGERNDLFNEASEIKFVGKTPQVSINQGKLKELMILKCLVNAPFEKNIQDIRNLPVKLGDLLYKECDEFNSLDVKKKE